MDSSGRGYSRTTDDIGITCAQSCFIRKVEDSGTLQPQISISSRSWLVRYLK
jgi:hypothetical protein